MLYYNDLDIIKPFQDNLWVFIFSILIIIAPRESGFNLIMLINEVKYLFLSNSLGRS
jgi:hypothetical protein